MNIYLHIGLEKTGTTSIQNYLKRILESGLIKDTQYIDYNDSLNWYNSSRKGGEVLPLDDICFVSNTVIISNEHFSLLDKDEIPRLIEIIRNKTQAPYKIFLVAFFRNQLHSHISKITTSLLSDRRDDIIFNLFPHDKINYNVFCELWEEIVNPYKFIIGEYSESNEFNAVKLFCELVSIPYIPEYNSKKYNIHLSRDAQMYLVFMNGSKILIREDIRNKVIEILADQLKGNPSYPSRIFVFLSTIILYFKNKKFNLNRLSMERSYTKVDYKKFPIFNYSRNLNKKRIIEISIILINTLTNISDKSVKSFKSEIKDLNKANSDLVLQLNQLRDGYSILENELLKHERANRDLISQNIALNNANSDLIFQLDQLKDGFSILKNEFQKHERANKDLISQNIALNKANSDLILQLNQLKDGFSILKTEILKHERANKDLISQNIALNKANSDLILQLIQLKDGFSILKNEILKHERANKDLISQNIALNKANSDLILQIKVLKDLS